MAAFAHGLAVMDGSGRLARSTEAGVGVAGGALGRKRNIAMELAWRPAAVATLVATVTVGDRHSAEALVRDVAGRNAAGWRETTGVARRALVGNRHLGVVPFAGLPARGVMATHAICGCGHVRPRFTCGRTTVVACGAVGRRCKQGVVRLSASPRCSGLVAILANRLAVVDGGCRLARSTEAGVGVTGGALGRYRDIGVEFTRTPACSAALVAAVAVGNGHATKRLVRYVVCRGANGGREASGVTGAALVGHRHLRVVPLGVLPASDAVAADAIH